MNKRFLFLSTLISAFLLVLMWQTMSLQNSVALAAPAIQAVPELTVEKTATINGLQAIAVLPGQSVLFEITVSNPGGASVGGITVIDSFDNVVFLIDESSLDPSPLEVGQEGGRLSWQIDSLDPGVTRTIQYGAIVNGVAPLRQKFGDASSAATRNVVEALVNGTQVSADSVDLSVTMPMVKKSVEGSQILGEGRVLTMTLSITNGTSLTLTDVRLEDSFLDADLDPTDIIITSCSVADASDHLEGSSCSIDELHKIAWSIGQLGPGENGFVRYAVRFDERTLIHLQDHEVSDLLNRVSVTASNSPGQVIATLESPVRIQVETAPLLSIRQDVSNESGEAVFRAGDTVLYTVNVDNSGTAPAENVAAEIMFIKDVLQRVLQENGLVPSGNGIVGDASIRWDLPLLPAKESWTISYSLQLKPDLRLGSQVISSTGTVGADGFEPVTESLPRSITVLTPRLSLEALEVGRPEDGAIGPGDTAPVTIRFANTGTAAWSQPITLLARYNQAVASVDPASIVPSPDSEDSILGEIVWTFEGGLLSGDEAAVSYSLVVSETLEEEGKSLENAAELFAGDAQVPDATIGESEPSLIVIPPPTPTPEPTAQETTATVPQPGLNESENFPYIAGLIGLMIVGFMIILGRQARNLAVAGTTARESREVIEMFTILAIISALLILSTATNFDVQATITVLSGIAGYILGRGARR